MRWKAKVTLPKDGDWRKTIKFAWFPILIGDTNVWLEHYIVNEKYSSYMDEWFVKYLSLYDIL
jgi:hypothetical protein